MASKLFKETDSWGDSSGNSENVSFSFKKTSKNKKNKKSKPEKIDHEDFGEPGRFVRAPEFLGLPYPKSDEEEKPATKEKNRKRKHETTNKSLVSPEKKEKSQQIQEVVDSEQNLQKSLSYGDKLRENLKGSRFRFLNEQMYKQTGAESMKTFKEDSTAFQAYHEGYRHQISQWPMNPLDRIIKNLKKLPKNHVVVDMGCGDARLSKTVQQKVYSIDLVSQVEGVIESDMAKTPLEAKSVHVVVYCLSLMGTNLKDFFIEANRILKLGGLVKIAEVSSRFENVNAFVDSVQKCGFELISKDLTANLFYFLNFKKTHDVNSFNKKIPDFSLNPCLYKKR